MPYVVDQSKCCGCHRCRTECPIGAITIRNAKYFIQPEKCVGCGACAKVCHNAAISDPQKPSVVTPHQRIVKICDVCVVGAGGAGMVAAAKAVDAGLKVVTIEKGHEAGGSAWYAGGFITNYSKWHREMGLEDPREKQFAEFMDRTENRVDPALLKRMFQANGDFLDWLIDEHDFSKDYCLQDSPRGYVPTATYTWPNAHKRIDRMIGPGEIGSYLVEHLLADYLAKGGEILYKTAGKRLICDDSGAVTGILATDLGGEVEIRCKSLILATGTFSHNRDIMDKMQPVFYDDEGKEPIHIFAYPTCTGDAITMGEALGADVDYVNQRVAMFGPMRHPYPCPSLHTAICGSGARFGSSGNFLGLETDFDTVTSPLLFDPKRYCWHVVDTAIVENTVEKEVQSPPQSFGMDLGKFMRRWREIFAEEEADGSLVSAPTLEGLAKELGFDPVRFTAGIDSFNRFLSNLEQNDASGVHRPRLPIRCGPFYAIKLKLFHENAIGGLVIDRNASVLKQGQPIPGLYAAGDTTRGVMVSGNVSIYYIERIFSALTKAYNEGYIAAEEAIKYAANH